MKILVTGFKPFLNNEVNPTETLVKTLINKGYKGEVFEVTYKVIDDYFSSVDANTYDFIISFGLASGRKEISIEQYAYNKVSVKVEDASGFLPSIPCILKGGIDKEISVIKAEEIVDRLKETGVDSYVSNDPGSYLCNYIYYTSLRINKGKALFIHLPKEDEKHTSTYFEKAAEQVISSVISLLENLK